MSSHYRTVRERGSEWDGSSHYGIASERGVAMRWEFTASCDKGVGVGREFKLHDCVKGGWSGVGVDIHFCATKE